MMGTVGEVAVVPKEISTSIMDSHLLRFRPNSDLTSPEYVSWLIKGSTNTKAAIHGRAHGAIMKGLNSNIIKKLPAPLPSLSEQRLIVETLDQADRLRKLRVDADAKAERIMPALFIKMFGDPVANPKKLKKKRLGDLIKVKSGKFLPAKNMDSKGRFPVYGGNGINGYHSKCMFKEPIVVIGRVGIYCGTVYLSEPNCWVTDNALYVAECSDKLHQPYLTEALRMANLNRYAGRAAQPLISGNRIYPVEILVPSIADQERFAIRIEDIHNVQGYQGVTHAHLEKLFSVLLHRAFTGDLTTSWREAHMKELLQEMEIQAKALGLSGEDR
jgi:type I restriction enzyme S subunit